MMMISLAFLSGAFAVRQTGLNPLQGGCVMPISIRRRDKTLDRRQAAKCKGVNMLSARNPDACFADRKPEPRILCGSV
jgi:hypothetical protein